MNTLCQDGTIYDEEVDLALTKLKCEDLFEKVGRLTAEAKTDADFQMAFNQANSELLSQLNQNSQKKPPLKEDMQT